MNREGHLVNSIIISLIILVSILAGTIFSYLQHFLEILLFFFLFILILRYKIKKMEYLLFIVFVFSQMGSFIINDFSVFLLNAKEFGIGILSIIYFQRNARKTKIVEFVIFICCFLVVYEYAFQTFPLNIVPYLSIMKDSYGSRVLGLFLNFQLTSAILAIYFIGYTWGKRAFLIDFLLLFIVGGRMNMVGYIFQRIFNKFISFFSGLNILWAVTLVVPLLLLINYQDFFLEKFKLLNWGYISGYIILKQIFNPSNYLDALFLFPQDSVTFLTKNTLTDFSGLGIYSVVDHASELSITQILVKGGFFLTTLYLYVILILYKRFALFIFISLFHVSFIFNPFIIYLMSCYQFDGDYSSKAY